MADEDDDFEDLFSFGVTTPGAPSSISNDVNSYITPRGGASASASLAERGRTPPSAGDDFNDIFGTPPNATARHRHLSDEFHVHDEDTRDMLEWLDDDDSGKKGNDANDPASPDNEDVKVSDDDDFDFDQILAGNSKSSTYEKEGGEPQGVSDEDEKCPEENVNIKHDDSNFDDSNPMSLMKPTSSCIEKELSLDQWDDENDGSRTTDDNLEEATKIADGDDSLDASPKPKDGVGAGKAPHSPQIITFSSLADAIRASSSTIDDVRTLFSREKVFKNVCGEVGVSNEDRAYLWIKVICGKTLDDIELCSLADSFREWQKRGEVAQELDGYKYDGVIDSLLNEVCGASSENDEYEGKKQALIMLAYFQSRNKSSTSPSLCIDPLILPVALAILEAGIHPAAASVVLSHIEPSSMPLLRLEHYERYLAAKAESFDLYMLACYHLPMLVVHLDRHCPGWHWPKKDNKGGEIAVNDNGTATHVAEEEEVGKSANAGAAKPDGRPGKERNTKKDRNDMAQNGLVPLSWFVTNFAGECGSSCLVHKILLPLWDNILTKGDHSWKYFLAIAVLEKHSDILLMSRGEELRIELEKIFNFREDSAGSEANSADGYKMTQEWLSSAKSLIESTPSSVIELLRSADDRAVARALKVRQTKIDEELQAQLEAEEAARKKEILERDKEADDALTKARLTVYYRTYNPEKVDTVDQILKLFDGRTSVLNDKLKRKYGKGFLPDEPLKDHTRSFLMSFNQSIAETRKHVSLAVSERRKKNIESLPESRAHTQVVLEVSTTEVIPVICTTKGLNLATGRKMSPLKRTSGTESCLHFFLVDCRPESIAAEQGRFPTAVTLSPEKLQDPDELQKLTDMFESLRSSVHICVMGEGIASFPVLYNHALSKVEEKLLEDDVARTSNCALFFLKKGFPFVSVLRGGFAAAHAFLSRNGPSMDMSPEQVLVEYDPDLSLFAQLESARQEEDVYKNAPAQKKTAILLQKIIDRSMVRLTLEEQRINDLANELAKPDAVDIMKHTVVNSLAGLSRVKFITKKDKVSDNKTELVCENDKGELATKDSSDHLGSSGISLPDSDSGGKAGASSGSEKAESCDSLPSGASSDEDRNDDSASKISIAFASLAHLMQHSTNNSTAPMKDAEKSTLDENPLTNESIGSKTSFSSFVQRVKQAKGIDTKGSEEIKDSTLEKISMLSPSSEKEEIDDGDTSDNTVKISNAFALLTQRVQKTTTTDATALINSLPTTELKNDSVASIASFSSFTKRIKFGQQTADQLGKSTEAKVPINSKSEGNMFGKFSVSLGGSLSGSKSKEGVDKTTITEAAPRNSAYGDSLSKFSKSVGGFASLLQNKSVVLESSVSKIMFEDEARPKTRFERLKEEELISFGNDTEPASRDSNEGDDLLLVADDQLHGDLSEDFFADVRLSSSDEVLADVPLSSSDEVDEKK